MIPKRLSNFSWRNSHVHERARTRSQTIRPRSPTQPFLNNSKHPDCNEATSSGRISGSLPSARAWCRGPFRPADHLRESSLQLLRRRTICGQLLASSLDTRYLILSRSGRGGGPGGLKYSLYSPHYFEMFKWIHTNDSITQFQDELLNDGRQMLKWLHSNDSSITYFQYELLNEIIQMIIKQAFKMNFIMIDCRCLNESIQIILQWKLLNGITLRQRKTDSNNQLILISEFASKLN